MTSRINEMEDFSPLQLKEEALNEWISLGFDADTFSLQKLTETWLLQDRKRVEATEEELFRAKQQLVREYHAESTPLRELSRVGKAIAYNITSRFGEATDTFLSHQKPNVRQHAKDARQMSRDTRRYQVLKSAIYEGYRSENMNSVLRQRCNAVKHNGIPRPKTQKQMSIADFDKSIQQLPIIEPRQVVPDTIDHERSSQKTKQIQEEEITRRERNAKFWKEKHDEENILTVTTHRIRSLCRSNSEQKYKSCSLVTDDNLDNLKEYMQGTFPRPQVNIDEEFKRKESKKKVAFEAKSLRKKIDDLNDMLKILSTEHEINAQLFETQSLQLNDIETKQQVIQNIIQGPPRRDPTANEKVELHRLALQKQQCRNQITCLQARSTMLGKKIVAVEKSRTGPIEKLYASQKHEDIGKSNINSSTCCEFPVIVERSIVSPRSRREIYPEDEENSTDLMLGNMKKSSNTLHEYTSVTRKARLCLLEQRLAPIYGANESLRKLSAQRWCLQSIQNSDQEESELLKGRLSENQAHISQKKNSLQRSELCHEIEHFHVIKN
uniref:AlNc14C170G7984 protein n=1 Tax=Albugo laibachii Nc14 TaxID=890382 RepID=F0WNF9_9STRA|nr:AlNc14C170G7984 [Albugo laibachii Nc14]|eukprot:CCA22850.1 AlNc14C170G7984 [Albugo laibachii Nc14]